MKKDIIKSYYLTGFYVIDYFGWRLGFSRNGKNYIHYDNLYCLTYSINKKLEGEVIKYEEICLS